LTLHPIDDLRSAVEEAAAELGNGSTAAPTLERPKKAGFGDYSTNAAMLLAPRLGSPPREVAERLAGELRERLAALGFRHERLGEALEAWAGTENFEERVSGGGRVDPVVLAQLRAAGTPQAPPTSGPGT
jgi:hypothetical protein